MSEEVVKVMLADPHSLYLDSLAYILGLEEGIEVLGCINQKKSLATSLSDDTISEQNPVWVVDIDWLLLCLPVSDPSFQQRVVALSFHHHGRKLMALEKAGIKSVVFKDDLGSEISLAIREIAVGTNHWAGSVRLSLANYLDQMYWATQRGLRLNDEEETLVAYFAQKLRDEEIAWAMDLPLGYIVSQRETLMQKLNVHTPEQLMDAAIVRNLI